MKLDHKIELEKNLTIKRKSNPIFLSMIDIYLKRIQVIEDFLNYLLNNLNIDNAKGILLDAIGSFVDMPRNGQSDDEYRGSINLKIAINRSNGIMEVVRKLVKRLTGSKKVHLISYGGSGGIELFSPKPERYFYLKYIKDIIPFGINISHISISSEKDGFILNSVDEKNNPKKGLGSLNNSDSGKIGRLHNA